MIIRSTFQSALNVQVVHKPSVHFNKMDFREQEIKKKAYSRITRAGLIKKKSTSPNFVKYYILWC